MDKKLNNLMLGLMNRKGSAMLMAMGMVFLVGAATSSLYYQGFFQAKFNDRFIAETRAMELASSGIELARYTLRHSANDCFDEEMKLGVNNTLFDSVNLGENGLFTVKIFPVASDPYSVVVSSAGTYTPTNTTAVIEEKMTCGYLNAIGDYTIISEGDLTIKGNIVYEEGSYQYANIHSNGIVTVAGEAVIPSDGTTISENGTGGSVPDVTVAQTSGPVNIPATNVNRFEETFFTIFPNFPPDKKIEFDDKGGVSDGEGTGLMPQGQTQFGFGGFTFMNVTGQAGGGGTTSFWQYDAKTQPLSDGTALTFRTPLKIEEELGTELAPKGYLIVATGDISASKPIHLKKPDDTLKTTIAGPLSIVTEGNFTAAGDVSVEEAGVVVGGNVQIDGTLTLKDAALVAKGTTELSDVNISLPPYAGYPVVHNLDSTTPSVGKDGPRDVLGFVGDRNSITGTLAAPLVETTPVTAAVVETVTVANAIINTGTADTSTTPTTTVSTTPTLITPTLTILDTSTTTSTTTISATADTSTTTPTTTTTTTTSTRLKALTSTTTNAV